MIQTTPFLIISYKPILYKNFFNGEPYSHVHEWASIVPRGVSVIHYERFQNCRETKIECVTICVQPDCIFFIIDD